MRDCPCNGCVPPKRHEACHDHCIEYKEWKQPIVDSYDQRATAVNRRMLNDDMYRAMEKRLKQRLKRR